MSKNEYFNNALADFVFDMANGRAIRHLAGHGYTVKQILEQLDFSSSYEKVQQTVWETLTSCHTLLLEEPGTEQRKEKTSYVEEHGRFGKTSFRRIVIPEEICPGINWKEIFYTRSEQTDLVYLLRNKYIKNGNESAYVSCDFGILKRRSPKQYKELLNGLDVRQKEYIEGLPWPNQRTYHRMDARMTGILSHLLHFKEYEINCYFMELMEKIIIK